MKLLFENWRQYLTQEGLGGYIPGSSERKMNKAIALDKALDNPEYKSTWDKIKEEIRETGEAYDILKKSLKRPLTNDEKETLWAQIKDIARGTALGAIFVAPGGSLLLPTVLKHTSNLFKPSAFRERVDYPVADWPKLQNVAVASDIITIKNITDSSSENSSKKIALLSQLENLMPETDEDTINSMLASIYQISGYSSDFDIKTKEEAKKIYLSPLSNNNKPQWVDPSKTISLQSYYRFLDSIRYLPLGSATREDKIKDFFNSFTRANARRMNEQTEPFQQAVKKDYRKMKMRLIGTGPNKYNVGGKMKKPPPTRSKSAPVGFGGSLEESKEMFPYQVYCDMDGVLVDFEKGAVEQINKDVKDKKISGKSIEKLRQKLTDLGRDSIVIQDLAKMDKEKRLKSARKYMYSRLEDDATFWAELEWNRGGEELWTYISKFNPYILTAPMQDEGSRIGKDMWIEKNLSPAPEKVFMSHEKYKWAIGENGSPNVLIDDFTTNTIPWEEHGGIAILHTSTEDTIKQLEELMREKNDQ